MEKQQLRKLIEAVSSGDLAVDDAVNQLAHYPVYDLGHTRVDTQRESRSGFGEVIFGEGKGTEELLEIISATLDKSTRVLVTRLRDEHIPEIRSKFPALEVDEKLRIAASPQTAGEQSFGRIGVVTAGTSDAQVAGEAARCAQYFGLEVTLVPDVGVAGLPRLFQVLEQLREQDVLIVVAGMEGALPGVVGGLVQSPVIAVPTSVGYGATFGGITAFLSMLVSCSPGLTVVNIDNGFGAALAAARMLKHIRRETNI